MSPRATGSEKVRENRLRRMADRQGYVFIRSRRRDPRAIDYGLYFLVNTAPPGGHWRASRAGRA